MLLVHLKPHEALLDDSRPVLVQNFIRSEQPARCLIRHHRRFSPARPYFGDLRFGEKGLGVGPPAHGPAGDEPLVTKVRSSGAGTDLLAGIIERPRDP